MGVNGKALQLHSVYFFTASHTRICISTTSHMKITIVRSYTGKYHEFVAVCYK